MELCVQAMPAETHAGTLTGSEISLQSVAAAVEEFARAAKQARQYPAYHPMMEAALDRAREALVRLFPSGSADAVRLTTSRAGILFNAELLPKIGGGVSWLNKSLRRRLVKTLFLRPGIQTREVDTLLQLLFTEPKELSEKGGVAAWLSDRGMRNVEVEQQDYRRLVRESEAALLQMTPQQESGGVQQMVRLCMGVLESRIEDAEQGIGEDDEEYEDDPKHNLPARLSWLLDFISATPSDDAASEDQSKSLSMGWETLLDTEITPSDFLATGLGNLIQVSFEALEKAAGGAASGQSRQFAEWQRNLVNILRGLDEQLRARLFRVPVVVSPDHEDALIGLASGFSPEEIVEGIVFAHPNAAAGEASSALNRLFRRIMPTPARREEIEPLLKERFLAGGMPEETYRNVIGLLLENLAKEQTLEGGNGIFRLREEEAGVLGGFAPLDLSDLTVTLQPERVDGSHSDMLLDLLRHESSPAEYAGLCAEIASWTKRWQEKDERERALELFRALMGEANAPDRSPSYRLIAASAAGRLDTPEFVSWLAEIIPTAPVKERGEILNLLARLGENAGNALLRFVFEEPDDELVREAVLAICQAQSSGISAGGREKTSQLYDAGESGEGGLSQGSGAGRGRLCHMVSEALVSSSAERTLRVTRLLLSTGKPQVIEPVMGALRHPQARVISGIMQAVGEFKPPEGEKILFAGLRDGYWEVRARATRSLGDLAENLSPAAARQAVKELSRLARQPGMKARALAIRIAAIESLGRLGREEAVAILEELLEPRGWLFPKARGRVSQTAAMAMANIPARKAREVLEQRCASRKPSVAKICRTALAHWKRRQEQRGRRL
jgi:HEAT repeat protein